MKEIKGRAQTASELLFGGRYLYFAVQINVVKDCVSAVLVYAT